MCWYMDSGWSFLTPQAVRDAMFRTSHNAISCYCPQQTRYCPLPLCLVRHAEPKIIGPIDIFN